MPIRSAWTCPCWQADPLFLEQLGRQFGLDQPLHVPLWLYLKAVVMPEFGLLAPPAVMIAMALEPALLIADAPTTALDVTTQMQILRPLREIQYRRGTGVLFITHVLRVAARICDPVAVKQRGRIVEIRPTAKVLAAAEHAHTRELLASIPGQAWTPPRG